MFTMKHYFLKHGYIHIGIRFRLIGFNIGVGGTGGYGGGSGVSPVHWHVMFTFELGIVKNVFAPVGTSITSVEGKSATHNWK